MSHNYPISPDRVESEAPLCEHCGMPTYGVGESPLTDDEGEDEDAPEFCSDVCKVASEEGETLPSYDDETFFHPGVSAIDLSLPQGMPRDSLNLLSGEPGTRMHAVLIEIAWRALQRGEPVALVCVSDPPIATLRQFLSLKWNILPHLESGRLRLIDCYTHREDNPEQDSDVVCGAWSAYLRDVALDNDAIAYVHDPTQPRQFQRHLRTAASDLGMNCKGTIIFDSLTEIGTLMRQIQGYELLKNLRAEFAKNRAVTVFCGSHYGGDPDEFPHQLEYLFDGIIDFALNPKIIPSLLIKQMTVRKMSGVMSIRETRPYEYMEHTGMMVINPGGEEAPPEADAEGKGDGQHPSEQARTSEAKRRQREKSNETHPAPEPALDELDMGDDGPGGDT